MEALLLQCMTVQDFMHLIYTTFSLKLQFLRREPDLFECYITETFGPSSDVTLISSGPSFANGEPVL